jgi:preprotein translocase subunit Sec63
VTRKEWEKIKEAADLLGLGQKASLAEIKKAYRRLSKEHHPDMQNNPEEISDNVKMHKLTEAYQLLLRYCTDYRFPLVPEDDEQLEAEDEDWWYERFGENHHWGN